MRGEKFEGSPCFVCGNRVRYKKSNNCVVCRAAKNAKNTVKGVPNRLKYIKRQIRLQESW